MGDDAGEQAAESPSLVIRRGGRSETDGDGGDGESAGSDAAGVGAPAAPPVDPYRPLTLAETLDMIQDRLRRIEGTWQGTALTILGVALMGAVTWGLVSVAVPWSGGIVESVQAAITLDVGWPAIPAPDDPRVHRSTSLVAAAWVGAPLVLGVFWFTAAYHLDRTSRRAFWVVDGGLVRQTAGYTVVAIGVIFPLIILGLVGSAWGVFALITWAAAGEAWGTVGTLVGLLAVFAGAVRAANAVLDRRYDG
ncbi:MAG: hypothetical protein OXP73_12580 [Chloroflexota bacterium]|nr:hypothetical protein [Chloroflexota bacterium]